MPSTQLRVQAMREEETESKDNKDKLSEETNGTDKREGNKKRKKKHSKNLEKEKEDKEKIVVESKVGKKSNNVKEKTTEQLQVTTATDATCNNTSNSSSTKKRKEVFPFGNYRNYYGYRIGQDTDEDPRLKVFRREWFQGKDCLDIGCNSGVVTIQIGRKFQCRSILGVDIDRDRISDAEWHLRKFMRLDHASKTSLQVCNTEDKQKPNCLEHHASAPLAERQESTGVCFPSDGRTLSEIVSFQQQNFVHSRSSPERQYDAILCLSVTKWIHLNWGDDGLITFFSKIWRSLREGGIFVLEPQPWKSYEKNRLVSEVVFISLYILRLKQFSFLFFFVANTKLIAKSAQNFISCNEHTFMFILSTTTAQNFQTITFYPRDFQEILLDKIGFRSVEDLTSSLSGSKTGFDRPILAFRK